MRPSALCVAGCLYAMVASSAIAQTEFVAPGLACRSWQLDEGLPDNSVASLLQARDGFLWLGTYDGFVRFDGRQFQSVRLTGEKSLLVEGILLLHEDRLGQIWGATDRGRIFVVRNGSAQLVAEHARFAGRTVNLQEDSRGNLWLTHYTGLLGRVTPSGEFDISRNDVAATTVDTTGTVWVLTKQGTLFQQSDGGWSQVTGGNFKNVDCRALAAGAAGELLVVQGNQLWAVGGKQPPRCIGSDAEFAGITELYPVPGGALWVRQSHRFRCLNVKKEWCTSPLEADVAWVQSFRTDRDGSLWLGEMGGGLTMLSMGGEVRRYRAGEGLNSNRVSSLEIDREGSLWIGFYDGGLQQARRSFFERVRSGAPLVPTSIAEDSTGNIWIAGHGGTLARWDGARCINATFAGAALPMQTRVAFCDRRRQLWAGTFNQGLWRQAAGVMQRYLPDEARLRDPRALFEDSHGRLWVGTDAGAFFLEDGKLYPAVPQGQLRDSKVCAFAESRAGAVWIATEGAGVWRWSDGEGSPLTTSTPLATATVSLLFTDDQDALWIGTRDAGLTRWKTGTITTLTAEHGLPGEQLLAMCDDGHGNFWFTSRRGIVRMVKKDLQACADGRFKRIQYLRFDKTDGLPTAQCIGGVQPSMCQGRNGRIWVPTSRETVSFDPQRVRTNGLAPLLSVREFSVNGKTVPAVRDLIRLAPGAERIELRFTALSFAAPARVLHAHRLIGLDDAWIDDGNSTHITYAHLRPGKYRLEIAAANEHGLWSKPFTAVSFQVVPHLWQATWFQVLAVTAAIFTSAIVGQRVVAMRWRRKLHEAEQRHALERERARIARDIHDELGANLTRITLLSQDSEGDDSAQHALHEIQCTAREVTRAMDEMVWAVNPQHDTVEGLITYLQRFAQRFLSVAGIRCRFNLPLEADTRQLGGGVRHQLFLAYKECLHNVVRHSGACEVQVHVLTEHDCLRIEVMDDGRGIANAASNLDALQQDRLACGQGIHGMTERLAQIGGQCEVLPRSEGGTIVRFTVPLLSRCAAAKSLTRFSPS